MALKVVPYFTVNGVCPPILPCLHTLYPEEFNSHKNVTTDIQEKVQGWKEFESENARCLGDLVMGFSHYYSYFN
jgi:poly(A) RNA polymerase GLD2